MSKFPEQVLAVSRVMVAWQPIGISMGVFDMCHRYNILSHFVLDFDCYSHVVSKIYLKSGI